jgi:sugar lactone lactonase YvrE
MRYVVIGLVAFVIAAIAFLLLWPVRIEAVAWEPGPNRGLTGVLASEETLKVTPLPVGTVGPEDVTLGPDGMLYTGLSDGRIVKLPANSGAGAMEEVVNTGGRPLGLQFDMGGNLIVADAFKGLISIAPDKSIRVLTDSVAGQKMIFVDDLDIAADGTIWFSDASRRFDYHDNILDFYEGQATGRLLSFNPATGETRVHIDNLAFANGVALGPDDAYVLINETMRYRTKRLWLKGAKAGQVDTFIEHLPAFVDNVSFDEGGIFWIAMVLPRSDDLDALAGQPLLRTMLVRIGDAFAMPLPSPEPVGWVIGVNEAGEIVHSLRTTSGSYATVTSANRFAGKLYLGSIAMTSIGIVDAP